VDDVDRPTPMSSNNGADGPGNELSTTEWPGTGAPTHRPSDDPSIHAPWMPWRMAQRDNRDVMTAAKSLNYIFKCRKHL
jgi:hypothetical protein